MTIDQAIDLAVDHHRAGRLGEAELIYRQILEKVPDHPGALHLLGVIAHQAGQNEAAAELMSEALAIDPENPSAQSNFGAVLMELGQPDQAIAAYRAAIQLKPDYAEAYSNLANALYEQGELDQAIAAARAALQLTPDCAKTHSHLGNSLKAQGRLDDAVASYRCSLALEGNLGETHWNLGSAHLLAGDFASGWPEMEWRWKARKFSSLQRNFPLPLWNGGDLDGRTILLHAEQGFGDTLQFIRYVPLVVARGGKIIVECQSANHRLLKMNLPLCQVIARGDQLPSFDMHCPLLSLPFVFGTTLQTIPAEIPYLRPDDADFTRWRDQISGSTKSIKVGLAWAGSPSFRGEHLRSPGHLSLYAPFAQATNVRFISLQKGPASTQTPNPPTGLDLIDWTNELNDFADTAALIANLDLVISSDTAVAHLAGAMGKPTWVLLPFAPDWRWMLGRSDSPWYPTMRLFRQTQIGQWSDVIKLVTGAIREL